MKHAHGNHPAGARFMLSWWAWVLTMFTIVPGAVAARKPAAAGSNQRAPQAMSLPQQPPSLPKTTSSTDSFILRGVTFAGNTVFADAQLKPLVTDFIGKSVTLDDLRSIAKRITAMYHARGYAFAQALVPVQEVKGGVVQISVVEGRIGHVAVNIAPDVPVNIERLRATVAGLHAGQPLNTRKYERTMLLLSDLPGIKAKSTVSTGTQPGGSTDLAISVHKAKRTNWSMGFDNFGTRAAGMYRVGASLRVNSPFGIGDNLDLRLLGSQYGGTVFGRLSYEAPVGYDGARIGAGAARVNYSLGGVFEPLDAIGTAKIYDVSFTYPVVRQRTQNFFVRVFANDKYLTDKLRAVGLVSHKRVYGAGFGWAWVKRDKLFGGGYFSSNGTLYMGRLNIRDPVLRDYDTGPLGPHTQGNFLRVRFKFSRLQAVTPRNTLYLAISGQASNSNLDASEKLALGGYEAVRAYPIGEVLADEGLVGSIEWRFALRPAVTVYAFYDFSRGFLHHSPSPGAGDNVRSLRGPGIGLNWAKPGNFLIDISVAWRTTAPAVTSDGDRLPRLFLHFQKFF